MDGWDGGIQEDPAKPPANSIGRSGLLRSPSTKNKRKKSVRFNNAVTVKVVPRVINTTPKRSFITGTLLDPTTRTFRYLLMFLLVAQTFGANFSRFSPIILKDEIMTECHIHPQSTFELLFGLSEVPSVILIFIVGYLIDRHYTVGKWAIGSSVGVVVGQMIFAAGAFSRSIIILIVGRVLFQAAAGSLLVAQYLSMARWLAGIEMGLAVGIALSASELTSYFSEWMLPLASKDYSVGSALLIGALMGIGSLSVTVLASAMDAWGNDQLPKPPKKSFYTSTFDTTPSASDSILSSSLIASTPSISLSSSPSSSSSSPASPSLLSSSEGISSSPHTVITTRVLTATMSTSASRDINTSSSYSSPILPTVPTIGSTPTISPPISPPESPALTSVSSINLPNRDLHLSSVLDIPYDKNKKNTVDNTILSFSPSSYTSPPSESPDIGTSPTQPSPARIVAGASLQITKKTLASSDDIAPGTTTSVTSSYRGSYGTTTSTTSTHTDTWNDTISSTVHGSITRQINEEGGHRRLLILLCITAMLLQMGGVLSHGINKLDYILNFAAASAPVVGWAIDRIGRPSAFLIFGAFAQVATLTATIIAKYGLINSGTANSVFGITLGIAWAFVICSSYSGIALLVPGGWGGMAFAFVTGISGAAISLAPILHTLPTSWIPGLACLVIGLFLVLVLYRRKSILNLNAHNIRRVVGYTVDEERSPLLSTL